MHPVKADIVGLTKGIDPITFELVKNGLASIADDMSVAHVRAAYSTVVKDMLDFSTAVCAPDGTVVANDCHMLSDLLLHIHKCHILMSVSLVVLWLQH